MVAGNPDHPEMIGVVGYAPNNTFVVRDADEVAGLPPLHAPLVVSQTTLKLKTFLEVAEAAPNAAMGIVKLYRAYSEQAKRLSDLSDLLAREGHQTTLSAARLPIDERVLVS